MSQSETNSENNQVLTVFFDGLCQLCSREIDHYRKKRGADRIRFVDITSADFHAENEGVDPILVHQVMHVKTAEGRIVTGVDSFVEIWRTLPSYGWLAKTIEIRPVRLFADQAYSVFAKLRPYLPRKKADCSQSPYCEMKESKT